MTARLALFVLLSTAILAAYYWALAGYVPGSWPWLVRIYALPPIALVGLIAGNCILDSGRCP